MALLLGEVDTVKTLLELGSDPNLANAFDGNHALVILGKLRSDENSKTLTLVKLLLDAGSDPLREVRYQADSANRLDATQTPSFHETPLLCSGKRSSVGAGLLLDLFLSLLVRFQNEELLKQFIEHHVDINYLNPETGISPLMLAATFGYQSICNLLIDAGAELNAHDHDGNTALHFVAQGYGEQTKVAEILLQRGADPQQTNEEGFTPAMLAKRMGNDACFKILDVPKDASAGTPTHPESEGVKDQNLFALT